MARIRVTFEVDTIVLFDRLAALGDSKEAMLGSRIAGPLLTGKPSATDQPGDPTSKIIDRIIQHYDGSPNVA